MPLARLGDALHRPVDRAAEVPAKCGERELSPRFRVHIIDRRADRAQILDQSILLDVAVIEQA
jgi:hypothetical protein